MAPRFLLLLGLGACGCSWSRFDDVSDNTPIVLLNEPGAARGGFGVTLATAKINNRVRLISGGGPGGGTASAFEIGNGDQPALDASDTAYCKSGGTGLCFLGSQLAGAGHVTASTGTKALDLCFIVGLGMTGPGPNERGIVTRCADTTEFALPVPESIRANFLDFALSVPQSEIVAVTADRADSPAILVSAPRISAAWFYAPDSSDPVELPPPETDPSYGKSLAVVRVGDVRVFAVGAPDTGRVWLFRSDGVAPVSYVGCLGTSARFGRTLTAGPVDKDANDDLVVADAATVSVFSGAALAALPAATGTECSLGGLPSGGLIASFGCGSNTEVTGCGESDFGRALAVGDLDADGDGEVIVGAPGMKARGEARAGAILVYNVEGKGHEHDLTDVRFLSSAEENDELGAALATPAVGTRNIIAAGASGGGKTALFYCSPLLSPDKAGARCQ